MKALCNKAMACGHTKCHRSKNASNMMSSQINIFLSLVLTGIYGVESREGITIEANALEDEKEYLVCDNLKKRIDTVVEQSPRKRKSDRRQQNQQ